MAVSRVSVAVVFVGWEIMILRLLLIGIAAYCIHGHEISSS